MFKQIVRVFHMKSSDVVIRITNFCLGGPLNIPILNIHVCPKCQIWCPPQISCVRGLACDLLTSKTLHTIAAACSKYDTVVSLSIASPPYQQRCLLGTTDINANVIAFPFTLSLLHSWSPDYYTTNLSPMTIGLPVVIADTPSLT